MGGPPLLHRERDRIVVLAGGERDRRSATVLYRVADEIRKDLCEPVSVPFAAQITARVQLHDCLGVARTNRRSHRAPICLRSRPYRPQTNAKAQRFLQMILRERGYVTAYPSSWRRVRAPSMASGLQHRSAAHGAQLSRTMLPLLRAAQ